MTKIDSSSSITQISSVSRKSKDTKGATKTINRRKSNDFKQLENDITEILQDQSIAEGKRKEVAFRKLIEWQFGENSLNNSRAKQALKNLQEAANINQQFAELIERLSKK
ncbi:MAG: hypothetical protein OQK04_11765 [Kangiellaceae bacterium]|nr:hypothetical protein [Kangiellaceae bacterium]MCW8999377.1 hypothetical protein [Kangiellaceae bacterium]